MEFGLLKKGIIRLLVIVSTVSYASRSLAKLRVAVLYPKVGAHAGFFCMANAVARSAIAEGLDIEVEQYESESSVFGTVEVAKRISANRFDIVIGARKSQEATVAAKVFNEAGIPFVAPTASNPQVTAKNPLALSMVSSSHRYAHLLAKFAKEQLSPKKVAVLANLSLPYSTFYAENFVKNLKKISKGIVTTRHEILDDTSDLKKIANTMYQSKPDLVYLPVYAVKAAEIFQYFADKQSTVKMISHATINHGSDIFASVRTDQHPDLYFSSVWTNEIRGENSADYLKLHSKNCRGIDHSTRTASGYDSMKWLMTTIKRHPKARGKKLIDALKSTNFDGIIGKVHFSTEARNATRPVNIMRVHNRSVKYFGSFYE